MSKFTFSFNADQVVITDAKNNAEKIDLLDKLSTVDSLRAIGAEQDASVVASVGALSLLSDMLTDVRFDFYKGKTPINEKVPKEFNSALRDKIQEYMKPAYIADKMVKGAPADVADNMWQKYAGSLNTGSFSNAKTWASKFFCQLGKTPALENGKLLPLRAIIKMLEDARLPVEDAGIAGKLSELRDKVNNRNTKEGENDGLGDYALAVACLKDMLATYEGLLRQQAEHLTQLHSDGVIGVATELLKRVQETDSAGQIKITDTMLLEELNPETVAAWFDNGQITAEQSETWAELHGYSVVEE